MMNSVNNCNVASIIEQMKYEREKQRRGGLLNKGNQTKILLDLCRTCLYF